MKQILITLIILAALGAGGYFGYQAVYARGETAGYSSGYPDGEEAGYVTGQEDGYAGGFIAGEQAGYGEGYTSGEEAGYQQGYDSGEEVGYQQGYNRGESTGYAAGKLEGYDRGYEEGVEAGLGHGYTLRDPTLAEATTFIQMDTTDTNIYSEDFGQLYVCSHYARDICNNAEIEGLRCAYVELRYTDGGHALVAFDTIDQGMVYFEPQSDEKAGPAIGQRYYQTIVPTPGYYYTAPAYDDTIMDILVIW